MSAKPIFTSLTAAKTRPMQLGRGFQRLLVEGEGAENLDVHINVLKVGSGPGPYHYHERCENVYLVLSGIADVTVDGRRMLLHEGEVAFIPPRVPHSAGNGGDVEAEVLEIYSPPRGQDFHVIADGPPAGTSEAKS